MYAVFPCPFECELDHRPDTSQIATEAIAPRYIQFSSEGSLYQGENTLKPLPFQA